MRCFYTAVVLFICSVSLMARPSTDKNVSVNLVCPSDVWLPCGAEIWNLSQYGNAYYYIGSNQYSAGQPTVTYDLTTCQTGKIYRTWSVEDYNWNIISCTQTIYVNGGNFNYYNIHWPDQEIHLYGCNVNVDPDNLPYGQGRPHFDYMSCSMVGSSYKDQVYSFGPDCKKILRKWTVLDWCNYYPGGSNPGVWTYTQTIKISNTEVPQLNCPADIEVIPQNCDGAYVNIENAIYNGVPCSGHYEIENNSIYADNTEANASGFYPIGTTTIDYSLHYACGEQTKCQQKIKVLEKRPVPYCLSHLSIALMPQDTDNDGQVDNGMVELWAKDLDYASYHPCRSYESLHFSFSAETDSVSRTFTCEHVGENELQLWVTDSRGNQSWCAVTVSVQNNAANIPNCQPESNMRLIEGLVSDVHGQALENVELKFSTEPTYELVEILDTIVQEQIIDSTITQQGLILYFYDYVETVIPRIIEVELPGESVRTLTNAQGVFDSAMISKDKVYKLEAEFNKGTSFDITEKDLKALRDYLDGKILFNHAYSYFAADLNEDQQIDERDYEILEIMYAGGNSVSPIGNQWIFLIKAELESLNPRDIPVDAAVTREIAFNKSETESDTLMLVGIKKGKLTYRKARSVDSVQIDSRSNEDFDITVYPNPFTSLITLTNESNENLQIDFFNLNGQKILSFESSESKLEIEDAASWQNGTYYYVVQSKTGTHTGKIIKL